MATSSLPQACPSATLRPTYTERDVPYFDLLVNECVCEGCTQPKSPREAEIEKVRRALPPVFFTKGVDQVFEPHPQTGLIRVPAAASAVPVVRPVSPLRDGIKHTA